MSTYGFVGDLLVRSGVVDAEGLARAMEANSKQAITLARALHDLGLADESSVTAATASALRLEHLQGALPAVAEDVVALLPAEFCRKRRVVPLSLEVKRLRVALTDPLDVSLFQDVEFLTGKSAVAVMVTQTWFETIDARMHPVGQPDRPTYDMLGGVDPSGELESSETDYDLVDPATLAKDVQLPPIVRLVNLILSDAAKAGASDVHIEPHETSVQVRQRVDGLLRDVLTIPLHLRDQTISRVKIISGMDIAERRKPQDGRSKLRFEGRRIDLRVSTLPTQFGEKVVIRLLNSDRAILPLDQIDFSADHLRMMRSFLSNPKGMVLVTGPTGSGKTSTLYTALNSIKSPTNNISTLEDPIEVQLPGINQTQINVKAGMTFAGGLRSILRQDPNVILVGEIRDQETARIALQAAQTGHLLLSTLHTNDAPATITRLLDLEVEPFLVASSVIGILAQRLVRRVCASCAVPAQPSAETTAKVGGLSRFRADGRWMVARGCEHCGHTGFKGRIAIHEVLSVNDELRELISKQASEHELRRAAKRTGMRTLLDDGIEKAAQGLTTLEELLQVVSADEANDLAGQGPSAREAVVSASSANGDGLHPPARRVAAASSLSKTAPRSSRW